MGRPLFCYEDLLNVLLRPQDQEAQDQPLPFPGWNRSKVSTEP